MPKKKVLFAPCWYDQRLHEGVARYAMEHDWDLYHEYSPTLKVPKSWKGDGIITLLFEGTEILDFVKKQKVPVVNMSLDVPGEKYGRVVVDNIYAGHLAAEYFLAKGFRHYAYVDDCNTWFNDEQWNEFSFRVSELASSVEKLELHEQRAKGNDLLKWAKKVVKKLPKPIAIFSAQDMESALLLRACIEQGIKVPDEVSILGIPNIKVFCECSQVTLSSIDVNFESVGYQAAALLDDLMEGRSVPSTPVRVLPTGIVERASTQTLAVTDKIVREAVEFMQANYYKPLSIDDIAAAVATNRSTLARVFKKKLCQSVMDHLTYIRLREVKNYLRCTGCSIVEIAERTGFNSDKYLHRVFRNIEGMTPRQYRKKTSAVMPS